MAAVRVVPAVFDAGAVAREHVSAAGVVVCCVAGPGGCGCATGERGEEEGERRDGCWACGGAHCGVVRLVMVSDDW